MRVLAVFGGFLVLLAVGFVVFVSVIPDGEPVDCDRVEVPTAAEWRALDLGDQLVLASNLPGCGLMDDMTEADVEAVFGPRDDGGVNQAGTTTWLYVLGEDKWEITFGDDGTVDETELIGSGPP
ncbi:hypothetical protein GCM10023340_40080 [Nocardioides marinquilinus]|uniref:Uncharacterized protein n=1 Tax=Nocardioides marinquilinus TaxID=1210400 RepID=A0ABP9Q3A4_9ACTN